VRLHHVGIVVKDISAAMETYTNRFNAQVISRIVDDEVQGARVVLLDVHSDSVIELVEPLHSESALNKVLRRRAPLHHLCFEVNDLADEIERLRTTGMALISEPAKAPLFEMRRIAWLCDDSGGLIELLESK
jgi:methylmalonyl-CoA/ethylmalonyl-CoA epimerase